jgi:hypothetical protein
VPSKTVSWSLQNLEISTWQALIPAITVAVHQREVRKSLTGAITAAGEVPRPCPRWGTSTNPTLRQGWVFILLMPIRLMKMIDLGPLTIRTLLHQLNLM